VSGCVSPALDSGAYRQNAVHALQSAVSAARTSQLTIGSVLTGQASSVYADTVITDSEDAISPVEASFGTVQPPVREDDQLRSAVLSDLSDVDDALAAARIAVRRDDTAGLRQAGHDLTKLADRLQLAQEKLQ